MRLSPPPHQILLCISPFCDQRLRRTQTFPSGDGASHVHGSITCRTSFAISANAPLKNLIQGGETLQRPVGIFGSLLPAGKITAQEAATEVPLVLLAQRGLRHSTGRPILQTPPPPGGGASHVHG